MRRIDEAHEIDLILRIHQSSLRIADNARHYSIRECMNTFESQLLSDESLHFGETRQHALAVADLASTLSTIIGLTAEEVATLRVAGLLHDVGKVRVGRTLLEKSDKLSSDELCEVQNHVHYGFEILSQLEGPAMAKVAQVALSHHERWDGSGYPHGIAGHAIPMFARLVGIADVYDALTTDRVYRPAYSHEYAVEWIQSQAGKLFDPELAALFSKLNFDQDTRILRRNSFH